MLKPSRCLFIILFTTKFIPENGSYFHVEFYKYYIRSIILFLHSCITSKRKGWSVFNKEEHMASCQFHNSSLWIAHRKVSKRHQPYSTIVLNSFRHINHVGFGQSKFMRIFICTKRISKQKIFQSDEKEGIHLSWKK